jgi:hypothetical protein
LRFSKGLEISLVDNVEGSLGFCGERGKRVLSLLNEETMGLNAVLLFFKVPVQVHFTLSERPEGFKNYIFFEV